MKRREFLSLAAGTAASAVAPAALRAQDRKPIRIGVLNDQSSVYSDFQGMGSVIATRLAVEDFGDRAGRPVEVIFADHQNKTDVGANIARTWFDQGVDLILDVPNSAVALAVSSLARERNRIFIGSGAGTSDLTGKDCSPNTVHWTYDTWSLGQSLGKTLTRAGGKTWFFITADYAFGKDLEKNAAEGAEAAGGKVLGAVRHPIGNSDFSSYLLQAQSSGADVIGIANAGGDTTNTLKQAAEFGIPAKQKLAGLIVNVNNVKALGLPASQGLILTNGFYWDLNDGTRAFSHRFQERHERKNMPNDMQAGCYSATTHYLKAIAGGADLPDGRAVVAAMKAMPTDDPIFGKGSIRADGRKLHPMYLFATKKPEASKGEWDYFDVIGTTPPEEAWRPMSQGNCPLVRS